MHAAVSNRVIIEEIGLSNTRDCLGYRLIVKSIERSADHAARIAKVLPTLTKPLDDESLDPTLISSIS